MEEKMKLIKVLVVVLSLLAVLSCGPQKVSLFNGKDFSGWTMFLDTDTVKVEDVWSVENGVIHCKGVPNGYMRTETEYSDYKLHLEWRWVEEPTNSGVLLHAQKPDQVWPNCIECQLKSGNAGDFVIIGPGSIEIDSDKYTNDKRFLVIPKKQESNEKAPGQWNSYDIECKDNSIKCYVNGVLQNKGTNASLTSGYICLQSEGSPIEFRNITLEML
jgi:hypothetical protein